MVPAQSETPEILRQLQFPILEYSQAEARKEGDKVKTQRGYVFHKGNSWFVRFWDDAIGPDGTVKRKQLCKRLEVPFGGEYKTRRSVQEFVEKELKPVNSGTLDARSTMPVSEFVDKIYLKDYVERELRAATQKQYRDVWENHIKPYMGKLTLRSFRTKDAKHVLDSAAKAGLGRSSLGHIKAFMRGVFMQALGDGILDGINPVQNARMPKTAKREPRHAYKFSEVMAMLAVLPEPAWTVVLTAAFSGLSKGELRGLEWADFTGKILTVNRVVWNSITNDPKTKSRKAPVAVAKQLADALEAHRLRMGKLAEPNLPIFQAGNGKPLNLDNLARRIIAPALSRCAICRKPEEKHKPEAHLFQRDNSLPRWYGWHAFRRGLATGLHELGTEDKEIQAILRHSDVRLTQNTYIQSVDKSQVDALDRLNEKFELCNDRATDSGEKLN
jgi:integrase